MRYAVAVLSSGRVNPHFGRAKKIALVDVEAGTIQNWEEVEATYAAFHPGHHGHHHDHHDHHDHDHHDHDHHDHDHHDHHDHDHHAGGRMDPERLRHQEAIRDFLLEHHVDILLLDHAGPGIARVLTETDIRVVTGIKGMAKDAVLAADHFVRTQHIDG